MRHTGIRIGECVDLSFDCLRLLAAGQWPLPAPGKYKLFAWEDVDDDLWPDAEFRRKYDNRAREINVAAREMATVQLGVIPADEIQ